MRLKAIEKSPLDLDDDLYLYKLNSEEYDDISSIDIFEHYEIHQTIPRKLLKYGHWTLNQGMDLVNEMNKWMRRKNLQGINFRILSVDTPGISSLELISGSSDTYTMNGLLGEIWFNLQVCRKKVASNMVLFLHNVII